MEVIFMNVKDGLTRYDKAQRVCGFVCAVLGEQEDLTRPSEFMEELRKEEEIWEENATWTEMLGECASERNQFLGGPQDEPLLLKLFQLAYQRGQVAALKAVTQSLPLSENY